LSIPTDYQIQTSSPTSRLTGEAGTDNRRIGPVERSTGSRGSAIQDHTGSIAMNRQLVSAITLQLLLVCNVGNAQQLTSNIPYVENGHERQILDIYTAESATDGSLPVMFWIHGGGWQVGNKSDVALKPKVLTERGFVFVSTNYRLLPDVTIDVLIRDVAKSLGWVHRNISKYGGDPNRIYVGGHSAGAQLAALICIDDRYLKEEDVSFDVLKGCVPIDGDTYDIPKIIMTAEHRQALYGGKMFTFGHRQKFGNDPEQHVDLSAVTHVASNKGIPPFLILFFPGNPDTRAQAHRLESVLEQAGIPVTAYGKSDSNHNRLNDDLGKPDDPATQKLYQFLDAQKVRP
jgi:acetyl esterase/lipase